MSEVTINYRGSAIATMDASGTKTLQTEGKLCDDDIEVIYARPSGGGGTGAQSGSFTPETNVGSVVLSDLIGTTKQHLLVKARGSLGNGLNGSARGVLLVYIEYGDNQNFIVCYTNPSGSATYAPTYGVTMSSTSNTSFDATTGTLRVKTSAVGSFYAGITFDWFAW